VAGRFRAVDYPTLSDLRYQIRRFLRIREIAARRAGVEPQHYLVLLHIKGLERRQAPTIGALAERLQITHPGVVQLIDRLVKRRMVSRQPGADRRQVVVTLTRDGESVLRRLAGYSVRELKTEGPLLAASLKRLVLKSMRSPARPRPRARSLKEGV
jgi:DNA-binding MarR family transcriptional regulator